MFENDAKTAIGGKDVQFPQTAWTRLLDPALSEKVLEELSARYWKPLYFYLRRKGFSNEHAKDLTQGFFLEVVLGGELIQKADQNRGKLRTLLLAALNRYVTITLHSKKCPPLEMQTNWETNDIPDHLPNEPIEAFNYAWASTLLDSVVTELKGQCCSDGKDIHWKVFEAKVLEPILDDHKAPSLAEICVKYGIDSKSKASNMIVTVKRRFRVVLRRRLRQTVNSCMQVEEAFKDLLEILSKNSARF